jgi:hypothetical protein
MAALVGAGSDLRLAVQRALRMSEAFGIGSRDSGLMGVWGPMVGSWLEEMMPPDAGTRCKDKVWIRDNNIAHDLRSQYDGDRSTSS